MSFRGHDRFESSGLQRFGGPQRRSYGISMRNEFKIGDHVSWSSEAGRVYGTIIRVHTRDFDVIGYTHHASPEAPQYEIKSSKTEHIAFHKGAALTKLGG
jgi:hypothetical protein